MKIALLQYKIVWADIQANLRLLEQRLAAIAGQADVAILPEMFSTGFCIDQPDLAEPLDGLTVKTLERLARQYDIAIVGSFIAKEERPKIHDEGDFSDSKSQINYNMGFFITPQQSYFEPKRHLFARAGEQRYFTAGQKRMTVEYKGVKFCLQICYDLRFPVWSRNATGFDYDVLIYVAAWPVERIPWWDNLLVARSIENQCIVCGVNSVGIDGNNIAYPGHSTIIDTRLQHLVDFAENEEGTRIAELDIDALHHFRDRCPMYREADKFEFKF